MNMSASPMTGMNRIIKRTEDILISGAALFFLSPIFLIAAIFIKIESKGDLFFKQARYGVDGKEFYVWKFRSMYVTEAGHSAKQATKNDRRITKVGKFIRNKSIDELPQLVNVLKGDMSLVGPRPHPVALNEEYRHKISGYMSRHKIHPGITGWAQINGHRGETPELKDMENRIRYDLEYIHSWSLSLDLRILLKTIYIVFNDKNAF